MPLEDGETRPDYPRPPCAPSFFKSRIGIDYIRILHQYFTHSLYVYAGETIMPPRVLASVPKPSGGNQGVITAKSFQTTIYNWSGMVNLHVPKRCFLFRKKYILGYKNPLIYITDSLLLTRPGSCSVPRKLQEHLLSTTQAYA